MQCAAPETLTRNAVDLQCLPGAAGQPSMPGGDPQTPAAFWPANTAEELDAEFAHRLRVEGCYLQQLLAISLELGKDPSGLHVETWQRAAPVHAQQQGAGSEDELEARPVPDSVTTLMIRGIPCKATQEQLIGAVDEMGFRGAYDFLFLPRFKNGSNRGYAFVNFRQQCVAARFARAFTNFTFEGTLSQKACSVQPARIQGKAANLEATMTYMISKPYICD